MVAGVCGKISENIDFDRPVGLKVAKHRRAGCRRRVGENGVEAGADVGCKRVPLGFGDRGHLGARKCLPG